MLWAALIVLCLCTSASATCPAGYTQIIGGDCFKVYVSGLASDAAEAACAADGGHLASIRSLNEQNGLVPLIGQNSPLLGLKCLTPTSCTWYDGTPVDFTNFQGGAPNLGYGSCVYLSSIDFLWYSWNCQAVIGSYLCRVPFDGPAAGCAAGYTAYNGGCAIVNKVLRSYSNAENDCLNAGGHLASIHSQADDDFYRGLAQQSGLGSNVYIGLSYNGGTAQYTWSDGSTYDYKAWATQFPNSYFGSCTQLLLTAELGAIGQWTNIPCDTPMAYVCFKTAGAVTPTKAPLTCNGIQYFYDEGTIYSPGFPVSLPASTSCEYIMAVQVGATVSLTFPTFQVDVGSTVALYDGIAAVAPFTTISGNVASTKQFTTTQNVMKLIFTSSATATGSGWQADFTTVGGAVNPPTTTVASSAGCPTQYYTADTYVYSPNWPSPYPPMSDCTYYISSTNGRKLKIDFGYMDTEQCCDYVTVYDGPNTNSPIITTQSGQSGANVPVFTSTGTTLTLRFISDSNNQGNGWVATVYNS